MDVCNRLFVYEGISLCQSMKQPCAKLPSNYVKKCLSTMCKTKQHYRKHLIHLNEKSTKKT